ncbi:MAG TPA: TatD family hydrolase [Vicinamibacterales bacterium]|nr:TatD family hydrolase [Vicinamibacterales bacterium]
MNIPTLVDSHCHLADEVYATDLADVVERARAAGLTYALTILAAGHAKEAAQAERLAALWPDLRFSVGVHPHQAAEFAGRSGDIPTVLEAAFAALPGVRSVGEIGLDYHYDFSPRDVQQQVFRAQVAFARERALPIVIHTREATEDTFTILREAGKGEVRGVFHCFTGDEAMARRALEVGFHLSFAGIVTFPKAHELRAIARWVPHDRLLIETDSPYLAPVPHRGKRNEPAWVGRVAETVAQQRGLEPRDVAALTRENFVRLFHP